MTDASCSNVVDLRTRAGLTPTQLRAIEALAAGATGRAAASAAGVRAETVSRWRRDPRFAEALAESTRAKVGAAQSELAGLIPDALAVVRLSLAPQQPLELRLRSALAVLRSAGVSLKIPAGSAPGQPDLFDGA